MFGLREVGRKPVGAEHRQPVQSAVPAQANFIGMGHWRCDECVANGTGASIPAGNVLRCARPHRSPSAGLRQQDNHALIGAIDQGAGDAAPTRLSTGLAPAGLVLRTW